MLQFRAAFFFFFTVVQALEEEVEALTTQLHESEAANDDLNLELQDLQEQLLDRCVGVNFLWW